MLKAMGMAMAWFASIGGGVAVAQDDPLTRPMALDRAGEWLADAPPERIFGNSWHVGFGGLSVVLIDTGGGLVLIDAALPQAAPLILNNVRKLGFDPKDIKYILSTEPHYDHAGGLAALARDTGATVVASARAVQDLRSGDMAADDPQLAWGGSFPAVTRLRAMRDGEKLRLGKMEIVAVATPGHTLGSMSWAWRSCEGRVCKNLVYASSLNPVAPPEYRFSDKTGAPFLAAYTRSHKRMAGLPCDILIAAHPSNAETSARHKSDPQACKAYAARSKKLLAERLATERAE